jgi:glutamyl-tRNA reductase
MAHLYSIGVNHKTTAIDLREKLFLTTTEKELILSELKSDPRVIGAFVLSTCNRTEIYVELLQDNHQPVIDLLFKVKKLKVTDELLECFSVYKEHEAVRHLFRVSSGLDSVVLGEKQILGQVKEAATAARELGMMTRDLNILTNLAIRSGKKAQTETEIGFGGSSVSWAAVATMQKRLGTLSGKNVLIVGAGKMGHLAAEQLKNKDVATVYVMNRSCDKAASIADEVSGTTVGFWEMKDVLCKVDACICSAGAPHYLIEKDLVAEVMQIRAGRELVLIDISMPRNIDPQASTVEGVKILTIDDLDQVVEGSVRRRQNAVGAVEEIVAKKENEYFTRLDKARVLSREAAEVY